MGFGWKGGDRGNIKKQGLIPGDMREKALEK
jgi:hypothetical protein